MQKIHLKQNFQLTKEKAHDLSILMILKVLLNTQMICEMFTKILKNTNYVRNGNIFDDIIANIINDKKLIQY